MAACWWVLAICAALAAPTAIDPASAVADWTYLAGSVVLTAALWWGTVRSQGTLRRIAALFAAAASCWLVGDLVQRVFAVADAAMSVPDVFWMSSYPLIVAAVVGILKHQGLPPAVRREVVLDSVVISAAATVGAWTLLIAPNISRSSFPSAVVTAIYPLGDVAVFTFALVLVMLPGRSSTSGRMIVGCLLLTLPLDFVNVTLSLVAPHFDVDRLDSLYLIVNSLLAAAILHPTRQRLVRANDQIAEHRLNRWRIVMLGVSLAGVVTIGSLPDRAHIDLMPPLVGSVVVCAAIIARFYLAVREREAAEAALILQALQDPLTGVGNRLLLVQQMARATARQQLRALVYIDLDGFKGVNDAWGHRAGDTVLRTVGQRLSALTREADVLARVGGDEFVVLCSDVAADSAETLAHRILAAIRLPIDVGAATATINASVGVVVLGDDDVRALGSDAELDDAALMHAVDEIMYQAKRSGGGVLVGHPARRAEHENAA